MNAKKQFVGNGKGSSGKGKGLEYVQVKVGRMCE